MTLWKLELLLVNHLLSTETFTVHFCNNCKCKKKCVIFRKMTNGLLRVIVVNVLIDHHHSYIKNVNILRSWLYCCCKYLKIKKKLTKCIVQIGLFFNKGCTESELGGYIHYTDNSDTSLLYWNIVIKRFWGRSNCPITFRLLMGQTVLDYMWIFGTIIQTLLNLISFSGT